MQPIERSPLRPHLHEARHARALLHLHSAEHAEAIVEFKQLASQGYLGGHESLAGLCDEIGLEDESQRHIDAAFRIDPMSPYAAFALSRLEAIRGRWQASAAVLMRTHLGTQAELQTELSGAMLRYTIWSGDKTKAVKMLRERTSPIGPLSPEIVAAVIDGEIDAESAAKFLENGMDADHAANQFFSAANKGSLRRRALLHQFEAETAASVENWRWTLAAIRRADAARLVDINWLRKCPLFRTLRDEPGYAEVEASIAARAAALVGVYRS